MFGSSWAAECTPFWEADRAGAIRPTLAFAALYWAYTGRVKRKNESGHSQFTIHRSSCLLAPGRSQYNIPAAPGIPSQFSTQVVGKLQWFPCPNPHHHQRLVSVAQPQLHRDINYRLWVVSADINAASALKIGTSTKGQPPTFAD